MRKHDVRKWIHAVLDMLPLFIIPIFAIYSHRHPSTDYEVVYSESETTYSAVRKYTTNDISNVDDFIVGNYYQYSVSISVDSSYSDLFDYDFELINTFVSNLGVSLSNQTKVLVSMPSDNMSYGFVSNDFFLADTLVYAPISLTSGNKVFTSSDDLSWFDNSLYSSGGYNRQSFNMSSGKHHILGSGLTIFENYFTQCFCVHVNCIFEFESLAFYNTAQENYVKALISNGYISSLSDTFNPIVSVSSDSSNIVSVTYDDTDIGSQFVYALYLPIEKYFNFNNVATFNNMYQWFTTNFFNGNVPLVVPIVWNIILYEFIMDILFLIYAVFMFIIDFVECLIDKAFGKSYRGGR